MPPYTCCSVSSVAAKASATGGSPGGRRALLLAVVYPCVLPPSCHRLRLLSLPSPVLGPGELFSPLQHCLLRLAHFLPPCRARHPSAHGLQASHPRQSEADAGPDLPAVMLRCLRAGRPQRDACGMTTAELAPSSRQAARRHQSTTAMPLPSNFPVMGWTESVSPVSTQLALPCCPSHAPLATRGCPCRPR